MARPQFAQYVLDVRVSLPAGPAPARVLLNAVNTDDTRKYAQIVALNGTDQRLSVPAGHYAVMVIATYLTLDSSGNVTAATDRFGFALNRIVATSGGQAQVDLSQATASGIWPAYAVPSQAQFSSQVTYLYLGDQRHADAGISYEFANFPPQPGDVTYQALFRPVPGTAPGVTIADHTVYTSAGDTPSDIWNLTTYHPNALVLGEHVNAAPSRFATLRSTVYTDAAGRSVEADWEPHYPAFDPGAGFLAYLPPSGSRLDHILGTATTRWESHYEIDNDSGGFLYGFGFPQSFAAGHRYQAAFLRGPLAPGVGSGVLLQPEYAASRTADELAVGLSPTVDTDRRRVGYVGPAGGPDQPPAPLRTQIYLDGQQVFDGTNYTQPVPELRAGGVPAVITVPAATRHYRIVGTLDLASEGFTLSTHAVSDYRFSSSANSGAPVPTGACAAPGSGPCTQLPLLTLQVPLPTSVTGDLPAGRSSFVVTVGHLAGATTYPINRFGFATSLDGVHYAPAEVLPLGRGRYRVTITNAASDSGKTVTTRITAADTDGSSLTQTVTAAYRIGNPS